VFKECGKWTHPHVKLVLGGSAGTECWYNLARRCKPARSIFLGITGEWLSDILLERTDNFHQNFGSSSLFQVLRQAELHHPKYLALHLHKGRSDSWVPVFCLESFAALC